jgi:hypothetical protein
VGSYAGTVPNEPNRPCTLEIASSGLITGTQDTVVTSFQFLVFTMSKKLLEPDALRNRVDYSMTFTFGANISGETIAFIAGLNSLPVTAAGPVQEEVVASITRGVIGGASSFPFNCRIVVP